MEIKEIEAIIEGILFAAGDAVTLEKLSEALELDRKTLRLLLGNMVISYRNSKRGIILREINGSYQLCTRPEHFQYVKRLFEPRQKQGLSQAAYETLAIIAYNGPITRARIEQIRGVNSDSALTRLQERNLIKESGRMDTPGRPMLYDTTDEFYRSFGFKSRTDLPVLEMNE